jgi:hypothetical protein
MIGCCWISLVDTSLYIFYDSGLHIFAYTFDSLKNVVLMPVLEGKIFTASSYGTRAYLFQNSLCGSTKGAAEFLGM